MTEIIDDSVDQNAVATGFHSDPLSCTGSSNDKCFSDARDLLLDAMKHNKLMK